MGDGEDEEERYICMCIPDAFPPKRSWLRKRCGKFFPIVRRAWPTHRTSARQPPCEDGISLSARRERRQVTPLLIVGIIAAFFAGAGESPYNDERGGPFELKYGQDTPWWSCLSAIFCHTGPGHLWHNVVYLGVWGLWLEQAQGPLRALAVVVGSATVGFAFHGVLEGSGDTPYVCGASGVAYGLLWYQAAALALNWSEMPLRFFRLALLVVMIVADVVVFATRALPSISYATHLFGSVAGIVVGLAVGANLKILRFELALHWFGAAAYTVLLIAEFATKQTYAAAVGCSLLPFLYGWSAVVTRRQSGQTTVPTVGERSRVDV